MEHPQEYGEFATAMGEADSLEVFLLGAAAFLSSPEFQKRLFHIIPQTRISVSSIYKGIATISAHSVDYVGFSKIVSAYAVIS